MVTERAPVDVEDDRMLVREVEAAIRSLTLVEGCPVADLRRVLEKLDSDDRHSSSDSSLLPMHLIAVDGLR